jgi:hypothetical protein
MYFVFFGETLDSLWTRVLLMIAVGGFVLLASKIAISIKYKATASPSSFAILRARNKVVSRESESAGCFANIPLLEWVHCTQFEESKSAQASVRCGREAC